MKSFERRKIVEKLLEEIEEEEIGAQLLAAYCDEETELQFFDEADRRQVCELLKVLSGDSRRHQKILHEIIALLEKEVPNGH